MSQGDQQQTFCHSFDLTKRLTLPSTKALHFIPVLHNKLPFQLANVIQAVEQQLSQTPNSTIHRLVVPTLLSPALYPISASSPHVILTFFHSIRSLLRRYPNRLTIMISIPLTLYPRETGLTRWMELLSDGVIELVPFPHSVDTGPSLASSGAATAQDLFRLPRCLQSWP